MLRKSYQTFNGLKLVVGLAGLYIIYRGYKDATEIFTDTKKFWDTIQQNMWGKVNDLNAVEPTTFNVSHFQRVWFSSDWKMKPEPRLIYENSYPLEISGVLDAGGYLKIQYRNKVM